MKSTVRMPVMTYRHLCQRCGPRYHDNGYLWDSSLERPSVCPRCRSRYWDKPVTCHEQSQAQVKRWRGGK